MPLVRDGAVDAAETVRLGVGWAKRNFRADFV
jgi:hypothetical protein